LKLIVDIGNTRVKAALFKGKDLIDISNLNDFSFDSIRKFVANRKISTTIISSVKENNFEIEDVLDHYNGFQLCTNTPVPVKNNYKTINTLGKDRLAAVVGAFFLYPNKDILVFDAGTCLTIDYLNRTGEYLGGRISPGIDMRYKALNTFTDKLPLLKKENSTSIIGNDTNSSINSGVQRGILAEVSSIISDWKADNPDVFVVATGGDCFFFEKELKSSIFANPDLVMYGLNEILDFNE